MAESKKPFKNVEELLELAKKNLAEMAKSGVQDTNWDELEFMTDVRIADFVEQRFTGMNENFIQMEHDINRAEQLLEHMEESPRKKAAQVVLDLYRQTYLEVADYSYMSKVYSEAQMLTISKEHKSRVSSEIRSQRNRLDSANTKKQLEKTEELTIYQNMLGSFFKDHAILRETEDMQMDEARRKAQETALNAIAEKLPAGSEFDSYRTMEGYTEKTAEPLKVRNANLIMNSNVLTEITVNEFPKRIRAAKPKRLDIEWGVSTFDNMMDGIYNNDELKAIKKDGRNFLDTVFLDGKPALSVLPKINPDEKLDDYMRRMKCEVVAYALEGKGRLDIAPFKKTAEGYEYKDPVPVHVKVNLKEEVSVWRKFKNFLGISKTPSKKERAERISLDELGKEERHDEIKAQVRMMAEREKDYYRMKKTIEKDKEATAQADLDFFGFMTKGKVPEKGKTQKDLLQSIMSDIGKVSMDPETAEELQISRDAYSAGAEQCFMMKTLHRQPTRVGLCRVFAMTQGMTMEEILSDDPALRERKEEIGKAFVEKVSVLDKKEFYEKHGKDADYKTYFKERQRDICDTLGTMMRWVGDQPFDFYRDPSPVQLANDYQKASLIINVTQDLFQCCPDHIMNQNPEEMEALQMNVRSIGELRHFNNFCENFMATESYVHPQYGESKKVREVANGVVARTAMDYLLKECKDITSLKEMDGIITARWAVSSTVLVEDVHSRATNDPEYFAMCARYTQKGSDPVTFYNPETEEYHIGKSDEISGLMKAQRTGNLKELMTFEEISMRDIQASRNKHMTPKERIKHQKEIEKQQLKQKKEMEKPAKKLEKK